MPPDTRLAGRYTIVAELGAGSFSRVYEARQRSTGRRVAIKVLYAPPNEWAHVQARFRREMRVCASLAHPNIVPLLDSGELADGTLYAVFDYVPGVTLKELLAAEGKLEVEEAVRLMAQVLDALGCAHAAGIVHRDIKPANIMISRTGVRRNALVLDFGLAAVTGGLGCESALTARSDVLGTPSYAAPEQLRGNPPSACSDLYSWGLVLLECLTGASPLQAATAREAILEQLGSDPIAMPQWVRNHAVGRVLAAVTTKDAAARRVTVAELLAALADIERDARSRAGAGPPEIATDGERRQLAIVACIATVECANHRAASLDDAADLLAAHQARCARIAQAREGTIVARSGGQTVIVFGYPQAHEDDARRAARTALDILAETRAVNARLEPERGLRMEVRSSAHVDLLVVREAPEGLLVLGSGPVVAEDLARSAAIGEVLASAATYRLLRDELPSDRTVSVASAHTGASVEAHRLAAAYAPVWTAVPSPAEGPLLERDAETAQLQSEWRRAEAGCLRVAFITGGPGIGKSRLLQELRSSVPADAWLECRCTPEGAATPLGPIFDLFRNTSLDPVAPPTGARAENPVVSPERHKELTFASLIGLLRNMIRERPRVVAIEDLQWADPTTIELVGALIDEVQSTVPDDSTRLLIVGTARPEFHIPWAGTTVISPARLTPQGVAALVRATLSPGAELPDALLASLVSRSEGVPLFVEELARMAVETSAGAASADASLPASLRELFGARLAALTRGARETAQLAAAIGREANLELLRAASDREDWALRLGLDELVAAQLMRERPGADKEYHFRHALTRDAAYESMLREQREAVHRRIARGLRERFAGVVEQRPELLAHHLDAGAEPRPAAKQWLTAGNRALRRAAYAESRRHLERGLDAAARLPASAERCGLEIELLTSLGTVMFSTSGWAAAEAEATFGRALALSEDLAVEVSPKIFSGLFGAYVTRADREAAQRLLPHAVRFAERRRDVVEELTGLIAMAIADFFQGRHRAAAALLDRARPLYRTPEFQRYTREYGWDGGIMSYGYTIWNAWVLGHPEQAATTFREMLEFAQRSTDPQSVAATLAWGVALAHLRRRADDLHAHAERLVALATEQKLYLWLTVGFCGLGAAEVLSGRPDAAIPLIRQGTDVARQIGALTIDSYYRLFLLEALLANHDLSEGLALAEETLRSCRSTLVVFHEPEVNRLRGELLHAEGRVDAAVDAFRDALEVSAARGALGWELRSAISLARALAGRSDAALGRRRLAQVLGRFEEGRDEADVSEARSLLVAA